MNLNNTLKQHHKTMVVAGCGLLLFGAIKQPTTAYAAETGPGVTNEAVQQQTIVSYTKDRVMTLGQWELQADQTTWKFKTFTGTYLTSSWLESQTEAGVWYFVDANGVMLKSTTTPDGYYVDANGKWFSGTTSNGTTGASNGTTGGQTSNQSSSTQSNQSSTQSQISNIQTSQSNSSQPSWYGKKPHEMTDAERAEWLATNGKTWSDATEGDPYSGGIDEEAANWLAGHMQSN